MIPYEFRSIKIIINGEEVSIDPLATLEIDAELGRIEVTGDASVSTSKPGGVLRVQSPAIDKSAAELHLKVCSYYFRIWPSPGEGETRWVEVQRGQASYLAKDALQLSVLPGWIDPWAAWLLRRLWNNGRPFSSDEDLDVRKIRALMQTQALGFEKPHVERELFEHCADRARTSLEQWVLTKFGTWEHAKDATPHAGCAGEPHAMRTHAKLLHHEQDGWRFSVRDRLVSTSPNTVRDERFMVVSHVRCAPFTITPSEARYPGPHLPVMPYWVLRKINELFSQVPLSAYALPCGVELAPHERIMQWYKSKVEHGFPHETSVDGYTFTRMLSNGWVHLTYNDVVICKVDKNGQRANLDGHPWWVVLVARALARRDPIVVLEAGDFIEAKK